MSFSFRFMEIMSGVKSVSRHEEALAGGGSFAPHGGLIA